MITKAGDIANGKFVIWAVPSFNFTKMDGSEMEPGKPLFTYKICDYYLKPYTEGSVRICEVDLTASVPPGIDLLAKCIEGLEEEKQRLVEDHLEALTSINNQLAQIRLLTGPSDDGFIPAERPPSKFDDEVPY